MSNDKHTNGLIDLNPRKETVPDPKPTKTSQDIEEKHKIFEKKVKEFYKDRTIKESESFSIELTVSTEEESKKLLESAEKIKSICEEIEAEINSQRGVIEDLDAISEENKNLSERLQQKFKDLVNKTSYPCLLGVIIFLLVLILIELSIKK